MSDALKTIIFLAIFCFVVPTGMIAARLNEKIRLIVFAGMVFFTALYKPIVVTFMIHLLPMPDWTGTARGFALTMSDIFSLTLLLSMMIDPRIKIKWFPPGSIFYIIYFFFNLISGFNAIHVVPWGFEIVKMLWMYVFFIAAYNYLLHTKNLWPLVYIICFTLGFVFFYGIYQKYFAGIFQVSSTLPHQNSLSLYVSLFGGVLFGILLNEKTKFWQTCLLGIALMWCVLLILFTFSRGGLICFFLGLGVVGGLSVIINRITKKKVSISILGALCIIAFVAYALPRIIIRFQRAPEASKTTRVNLNRAAYRIANDYFIGVGSNNFSEYSGPFRHYAAEQYQSTKITDDSRPYGGVVETIYLLVAAECGWLGLLSLIAWFMNYFIKAFILCFQLRNRICSGIAIGCIGTFSAIYVQSLIEWSLKQYANFYQLMLIFALISVVWVERKFLAKTPPMRDA